MPALKVSDKEMKNRILLGSLENRMKIMGYDKRRATKANPNPEPKQSDSKPYKVNPELLSVDHEVRLAIISKYIDLTEEEQQAILWHNGLYGPFKYEIQGKETLLYMILHFADMLASRVVEKEDVEDGEV